MLWWAFGALGRFSFFMMVVRIRLMLDAFAGFGSLMGGLACWRTSLVWMCQVLIELTTCVTVEASMMGMRTDSKYTMNISSISTVVGKTWHCMKFPRVLSSLMPRVCETEVLGATRRDSMCWTPAISADLSSP
jgi:hypothetical protein